MVLKAYCINLEKRKDRLESIKKQFDKIADVLVRVEGIDTKSSYGCGLSHLKCIQLAKEKNLDYILVIEDDCIFKKGAKKILIDAIKRLGNDWDILLGGISCFFNQNIKFKNKLNLFKVYDFCGFFCTVYNKRCYDKMLEWKSNYNNGDSITKENHKDIDRYASYLSKNKKLDIYCIHPFIATTMGGFSDIRNKNCNDDINGISKVAGILDKINKNNNFKIVYF